MYWVFIMLYYLLKTFSLVSIFRDLLVSVSSYQIKIVLWSAVEDFSRVSLYIAERRILNKPRRNQIYFCTMTLIKFTYSLLYSLVSAAPALLLGSSRAVFSDWIFFWGGNISNHIAHLVAPNPPLRATLSLSVPDSGFGIDCGDTMQGSCSFLDQWLDS